MKLYQNRPPPRIEAIQVKEENRDELRALPGVELIQEGHLLLDLFAHTTIIRPGTYLWRYEGAAEHFEPMDAHTFEARFQEVPEPEEQR